ncbi:MAG: septum site-determining protein MinC [Methylococcaceae bacterium]
MEVSLEIKASSVTLPVLRLTTTDMLFIANQLQDKLLKAPDFFRNAPVVIELSGVEESPDELDFPALIQLLRTHELAPVGIRGGSVSQQQAARQAHLAILADVPRTEGADRPTSTGSERGKPQSSPTKPVSVRFSTIVEQPVRSGQRIYAQDSDLIVLAQVSPGAEIMADGNIHVYGSLKGRAMAGVKGNTDARIFCSDLKAELVAIGGHYKISENLDGPIQGKSVQVYLRNNSLFIKEL